MEITMHILQKCGKNEVWYKCEDLRAMLAYIINKAYHVIVVRVVVGLLVTIITCINIILPSE